MGLLKLIIQADEGLSEGESQVLQHIADGVGAEAWRETKKVAMEQLKTASDIRRQAERVTRQEARQLIYDLVFDMAVPDAVVDAERQELDWLAKLWELPGVCR